MRITEEQSLVGALMRKGENLFLTGKAGTGKSTALAYAFSEVQRGAHDDCVLTATTGIAALNLQSQMRDNLGLNIPAWTIYRWAGILLGPAVGQRNSDYYKFLSSKRGWSKTVARVRAAKTVVIDEISMLPGRVLDYLDYHLQCIRKDSRPFGGMQVVVVGDFLQLPPVSKNGRYDWAFQSAGWSGAEFRAVYLQTVFRQREDSFVAALNEFRTGAISRATSAFLAGRVKRFVSRDIPRLMTHNAMVDKWNNYQLDELPGGEQEYVAEFSGAESECDFLRKNSITPERLRLKVGARVMVTQNLSDVLTGEMMAVNGQCGSAVSLSDDGIVVALDNGREVDIPRRTQSFNPQDDDSATMTQFPLRLAYAMSIHKSQGLSLDAAHLDIRAAREPGQAYVAISRLRSVDGLTLKDGVNGVFVSRDAIKFYDNL